MHRIQYTQLSKAQISTKLQQAMNGPDSSSDLSDSLAGSSLRIVTDNGPQLEYSFNDSRHLSISENGAAAVSSGYAALTSRQLVLFSHMIPDSQKGYHVILDQDSKLATVFEVWF